MPGSGATTAARTVTGVAAISITAAALGLSRFAQSPEEGVEADTQKSGMIEFWMFAAGVSASLAVVGSP